ncbi:MAG: TolC family outer membrane protein [Oceanospirillaceae bacterium]|nr:TolC family outer membrane protein [Oceanospirillaceae bacterium]MCP5336058.1 TolC family outer membrane protein [Oceanospirillaceae bacterium]
MKKSLLALATMAVSLTASATSLQTVYEQALQNDPQLAAAVASAQATQESSSIALGGVGPSLAFVADMYQTSTEIDGTTTDSNSHSYGLQFKQPLLNANSWYTYGAASSQAEAGKIQNKMAYQDLLVRVSEAYFNVLRAQTTLASAKAEEAAVKRQLEQTEQRFKVGLIAITDVHEARAVYDGATVTLIAAESQLDIAYEALAQLTGERYDSLDALKADIPMTGPGPADRTLWEQEALSNSLNIQAATKARDAAVSNHKAKRADHLPTLDLVASHSISESDTGTYADKEITTTAVGLELSVPLFTSGSQYASSKQAYYERESAEKDLESAQRSTLLQVRSYYRQLEADVARVKARKQAITSARSAQDATQTGYEVGTRNIVEVLQAQRSVFAAERDYETARYDYVIDLLKFKQAVGLLSPADLQEVNGWLEATKVSG